MFVWSDSEDRDLTVCVCGFSVQDQLMYELLKESLSRWPPNQNYTKNVVFTVAEL